MLENLRALRESKGISQTDLAEIVGVRQQSILKYEKGQSEPRSEIVKKLADYFEVTVDSLYGRTPAERAEKAEKAAPAASAASAGGSAALSDDEQALVGFFRTMEFQRKAHLLTTAKYLVPQTDGCGALPAAGLAPEEADLVQRFRRADIGRKSVLYSTAKYLAEDR